MRIIGDVKQFQRSLSRATTMTEKFGRVAKVGAGLALGGLAIGLEKSVKAAMRMESSQARMTTAFSNAHVALKPLQGRIEALEASSRKLGFTDEDTAGALGSLITATGNYSKAAKDLSVVQDVARLKHLDVADASKMVTMAMTGSQRATKALGIVVSPVTKAFAALGKGATAAQKAHAKLIDKYATGQAVIQAVTDKIHGQAQAFAGTASGGAAQFRAQLDHLEVSVGTKLLPALTRLLAGASAVIGFMSKHSTIFTIVAAGIGAAAVATYAWAAATFLLASPVYLVVGALVALGVGLVLAYKRSEKFRAVVNAAFHSVQVVVGAVVGFVKAHWRTIFPVLALVVGTIRFVIDHFHNLRDAVKASIDRAKSIIRTLGDAFDSVKGKIQSVISWVQKLIDKIRNLPHSIAINIVPHVANSSLLHILHAPHFQHGGTVPGPLNAPRLIVAHGGERVVPVGGGGGGNIYVTINAPNYMGDKRELMRVVKSELAKSTRAGYSFSALTVG